MNSGTEKSGDAACIKSDLVGERFSNWPLEVVQYIHHEVLWILYDEHSFDTLEMTLMK